MDAHAKPPDLPPLASTHAHGDDRRAWHPAFLAYVYAIAGHPAYEGIPGGADENGKADWTIPTGRKPGSKNWNGRALRAAWWEQKAIAAGIPTEQAWISKAARANHPWGWKPCQLCGRWLRLSYAYPTASSLEKVNVHLPAEERIDCAMLVDVYELAEHLLSVLGQPAAGAALTTAFPELVDAGAMSPGELMAALERDVVRIEARGRLSPGAMSNAPDRLDGFHTYNLCCRAKQDTGRSSSNLRTYAVDRRAFEHWAEGDWEAANVLMTKTAHAACQRCGKIGRLSADHVGPISLGFQHTPSFEALCVSCNSAKNNRMDLADVEILRRRELAGEQIASWHAARLWELASPRVSDDAAALRLSKLMNVNQHEFLRLLLRARAAGVPDALMQFLSPQHAERRAVFEGLDSATLQWVDLRFEARQPGYALRKASRLIRVAFEALDDYLAKPKRNVPSLPRDLVSGPSEIVDAAIDRAVASPSDWREPLAAALAPGVDVTKKESRIRLLVSPGRYQPAHDFTYVREAFEHYMFAVAEILATRLDDDHMIKIWDAGQS